MPDFILRILQWLLNPFLGYDPKKRPPRKIPAPLLPSESSTLVPAPEAAPRSTDDEEATTWEGEPPVSRATFSPLTAPETAPEAPVSDLDAEKKRIIWSILSVFETGKPEGDYSAVAVLQDGAGISYGKHQSTDGSGTLDAILLRYVDLGGGSYGVELSAYLDELARNESTRLDPKQPAVWPEWAIDLVTLLRKAGADPVMRVAQDQVFSERYWNPCRDQCFAMKLTLPLSWCAIYDTCVQSGPSGVANIRKRFPESPPSGGGDEKRWATAYLTARRRWLAEFHNPEHPERDATVRATTYRIDALLALVSAGNWDLATPVQIAKPKATIT